MGRAVVQANQGKWPKYMGQSKKKDVKKKNLR